MPEACSQPMEWWAIALQTHQEENILQQWNQLLKSQTDQYRFFNPRRKLLEYRRGTFATRMRAFYPGYAFIQCEENFLCQLAQKKLKQFCTLVKMGETLIPVPTSEMESIQAMTDQNDVVDISEGKLIGKQLYIENGPLKGHEARICKIDKRKQRVYIESQIGVKKIRISLSCRIH